MIPENMIQLQKCLGLSEFIEKYDSGAHRAAKHLIICLLDTFILNMTTRLDARSIADQHTHAIKTSLIAGTIFSRHQASIEQMIFHHLPAHTKRPQ